MPTALITGISGQDGLYLAELLREKGYRIFGTTRSPQRAELSLPNHLRGQVEFLKWSITDQKLIQSGLEHCQPDEVYNFAAYATGIGVFDNPADMAIVNGLAVTHILESIRAVAIRTRFCQASSSEIFGDTLQRPQSEQTATRPRNPYGAAKLYADNMVRIYRQRYGLHVCSAILFNHESPRREQHFVTRKISHGAAMIKLGRARELRLGNLAARRDWGFAGDYVRAMWEILQAPTADDYVVATGVTHSVQELCEIAFGYLGLNYRDHVRQDENALRSHEKAEIVGDTTKLRGLGWSATMTFDDMIKLMVDADMQALSNSH